ncbi:glutamate receptor ionotropic, kainate 2-like [Branchiostoma floridae x Branchiostoma japonicum]
MEGTRATVLAFLIVAMTFTTSMAAVARFGAIFPTNRPRELSAMRLALEYVNEKGLVPGVTLEYILGTAESLNHFEMVLKACEQADDGILTILGPHGSSQVKATQLVSSSLHIPQISYAATDPYLANQEINKYLLRMSPSDATQGLALAQLIEHFGWSQMSIIMSTDDFGTHGIVEFEKLAGMKGWLIRSVQGFTPTKNAEDLDISQQLGAIKSSGARIIILNCVVEYGKVILKQAHDHGMVGAGWQWLVTVGITGSILFPGFENMPDYYEGLIGMYIVDDAGELHDEFQRRWIAADPVQYPGVGNGTLVAYAGKAMDAVLLLAYGLRDMLAAGETVDPESLNCSVIPHPEWSRGETFLQHLHMVDGPGVTGRVSMKSDGSSRNAVYDVVTLEKDGWRKVGRWNDSAGLTLPERVTFMGGQQEVIDFISDLSNRTLRVVTHKEQGFVHIRDTDEWGKNLTGKERFSGFCIDLLEWLSEKLGFRYELYEVEDNNFGAYDPELKKWNGMVHDVITKTADIAMATLTITAQREEACDFTMPYVDVGLTFIMGKEETKTYSLLNFLTPFERDLWFMFVVTAVAVGIFQAVINYLSPYGYRAQEQPGQSERSKRRRRHEDLNAKPPYRLSDAVWQSFTMLVQIGPEVFPRSYAGRITAIFFGLGTMVLLATYTANLAAFLTVSRLMSGINSVEDLAAQSEVLYGARGSGATESFFLESKLEPYKTMARLMTEKRDDVMVTSMEEGLKKVREGNYAFISDNVVLDYVATRQPCDIKTVGRLFRNAGYGVLLAKGSPYTGEFSNAIIQARESGFIETLTKKWITSNECDKSQNTGASQDRISINKMLGVFVVIYGGMCVSLVVLVFEWLVASCRDVDTKKPKAPKSIGEAVSKNLRSQARRYKSDWDSFCGDKRELDDNRTEIRMKRRSANNNTSANHYNTRDHRPFSACSSEPEGEEELLHVTVL